MMTTFNQEREATIQFSDTFGSLPQNNVTGNAALTDFDAVLTAEVRNTGRFRDVQFGIGAWPDLGDYGAVLLEQLRQYQLDKATELGIKTENIWDVKTKDLHPDVACFVRSLKRTPVGVVNCAPRRSDHHNEDRNGDEFYVGITDNGVEIYSQAHFLRGLRARGLLHDLFRISNDCGLWTPGEQFRSSCVTQARVAPELLEQAPLSDIPALELEGRVAYTDTFGNVRLEIADAGSVQDRLDSEKHKYINLRVGDKAGNLVVRVVSDLCEIPEDELGIYRNPADGPIRTGPGYLELVKRVSQPNGHRNHAYSELVKLVTNDSGLLDPRSWASINIEVAV